MTTIVQVAKQKPHDESCVIINEPHIVVAFCFDGIQDAVAIEELDFPGIYMLLDDTGDQTYIGQAGKSLKSRVMQHVTSGKKDWATAAVCLTKYGHIDKSQLDYMEHRFIEIVGGENTTLHNRNSGNTSYLTPLGKQQADDSIYAWVEMIDEFYNTLLDCEVLAPEINLEEEEYEKRLPKELQEENLKGIEPIRVPEEEREEFEAFRRIIPPPPPMPKEMQLQSKYYDPEPPTEVFPAVGESSPYSEELAPPPEFNGSFFHRYESEEERANKKMSRILRRNRGF